MPLAHTTSCLFTPPAGRKVVAVLEARILQGGDDPLLLPASQAVIQGNDVLVTTHQRHWKKDGQVWVQTALLDGSNVTLGLLYGTFNDTVNRVRASLTIPGNGTLNAIASGFPAIVGIAGEPFEIESAGPGTAVLAINPVYFNQSLTILFSYTPQGGSPTLGSAPLEQFNIGTPGTVTFTGPNGGEVANVLYVNTFDPTASDGTNENGGSGGGSAVEAVPFNYVGPAGLTQLLDPNVEGGEVVAGVQYYVDFSAAATLQPDPVIKAMNPAHIVFECMTNREWGRGLPRESIDTASFEAAAVTLKNEGFGLCLKWGRRDAIDSFIQSVLDTIGAAIYSDRRTALLKLKLIRGDYVKSNLKLWTTANGILSISNSTVNTSTVVVNEVIVKYVDPVYNAERAVNVQNLASLQSGAFNTMTKSYSGIPTGSLARRVAQRDLRAQAEGLRRFKITMDRRGSDIVPGDVMRIEDVSRNIPDMVVRVATMQDGTLTDGQISFDVVQDVFSFPSTGFTSSQPPSWSAPTFLPCIGEHKVIEIPYFLLARTMRAADFNLVDNTSAYMGTIAAQGQQANVDYLVAVKDTAPTSDETPLPDDQLYCGYTP